MAEEFTLTIVDLPGNHYTVQVPRTATAQDVMNAVRPQLQAKYNSKFIRAKRLAHSGLRFEPTQILTQHGQFNPLKKFYVELEDKSAPLRAYFKNENRKNQGLTMRAKSNELVGGRQRRSRKSKRRTTRKR